MSRVSAPLSARFSALLGRGRPRPGEEERRRVAALARAAAGLAEEAVVKVSEIVCPDPACPGLETVILVMRPGARTLARKVSKPVAEVGAQDVAAAFAEPG